MRDRASSGIGRATAEAFAARGAKVVLAARREPELATLTSEIESRGGKASFVVTDVAIAKDVERMVAHAMETFGWLDYAVNNAGIEGKFASITDLPEPEWDRVLDTNLKGTFLCLKYEARAMLAGGHGGASMMAPEKDPNRLNMKFTDFGRKGVIYLVRGLPPKLSRDKKTITITFPEQPPAARKRTKAWGL
jgi:NAD(P)-dependent dehydrogenase (short-subunit alcohol dehydrogenase family)